ncbi:MAG TPA: VWA domain-containing protein [Thermoanaerobaculia bacterium]|jgi:VWFA-related protein|nr:VWA domain-containing protein [Thermoanaerobaculia bacterium]
MKKQCTSVFFAVLALVAATAGAQTSESITVSVIDVPVYVFSHGKPVRDLTKDDFELFVNGKRQTIDYFDRIDFPAVAATTPDHMHGPPATDPRERRLFLLLFDLVYNRPVAFDRARAAAAQLVDRALAQDFFGVAITTSRGATFIIPFTHDRDVIRRALLKLSPSTAHDSLAISITDAERQSANAWVPVTGAGRGKDEDSMPEIMPAFGTEEQQRSKNLAQSQLEDVAKIAARLAGLEGYKHVVLFSEGFSAKLFNAGNGRDPGMVNTLKSMADSFHAAGALFHTVDLGPVGNDFISLERGSANSSSTSITTSVSVLSNAGVASAAGRRYDDSRDETLAMFARETGGQFLHWTNDFSATLADLSTTVSAGYRLGFRPVNPHQGENAIDVKVKNVPRGTTVSFRNGFSSVPETRDAGETLLIADIIQNDIPQSGTAAAFSFATRPFIDVIVPSRQLAKEHGAITDATLILYIFDDKGRVVDYREKKISIPAAPEKDLAIRQKLALPPGKFVAKSLLRVDKSIGFTKAEFDVPDEK